MALKLLAAAITLAATPALSQPIGDVTWYFQLSGDAADGIIDLDAGETTARIELWADLNPDVNGIDVIGYADSQFELLASGISRAGSAWAEVSDPFYWQPWYYFDEDNSLRDIGTFQLPPAFNPEFESSDPVFVLELEWSSDGLTTGQVIYQTANRQNMDVYYSRLGGSQPWNPIETQVSWIVIPAPGALGLFAFAGLATSRKRR